MIARSYLIGMVVAIISALSFIELGVGKNKIMQQKLVAIRGVIVPAGWDGEGNVTEVAISAQDEIEYRIEPGAKERELMSLINREVEASGTVAEDENGTTMAITEYNVLGKSRN